MLPTAASIRSGNTTAAKSPAFNPYCAKLPDTALTTAGPDAQPISPAKASNANSMVPPDGQDRAAILKVPGQRIPTDIPHSAQPASPIAGAGANTVSR